MAKKKNNHGQFAQNTTAKPIVAKGADLLLGLMEKTKVNIESIKPILQKQVELDKFESPSFDEILKEETPHCEEQQKYLQDISEFCQKLKALYERYECRQEEVRHREVDLDKRESDLKKNEKQIEVRRIELNRLENQHIEKERDIIAREIDAQSGFSKKNAEALENLRKEVADLKIKIEILLLKHN